MSYFFLICPVFLHAIFGKHDPDGLEGSLGSRVILELDMPVKLTLAGKIVDDLAWSQRVIIACHACPQVLEYPVQLRADRLPLGRSIRFSHVRSGFL